MVRRLQRELLFCVEVEEGSQLDAPEIVLQGLPPEENCDTPGDVSQFPDEVEELPYDSYAFARHLSLNCNVELPYESVLLP